MRRNRHMFLKCFVFIASSCFVTTCTSRADELQATYDSAAGTDTFTDVAIFSVDNNPSSNPFGAPCLLPAGGSGGCDNANVFGQDVTGAPFPYEVGTVTLYSNGDFTIVPNSTQSSGNDHNTVNGVEYLTATQMSGLDNSVPCNTSGQPSVSYTVGQSLTVSPGSIECTNPGSWQLTPPETVPQSGGGILEYVSNGEFIAADTSLEVVFQLPMSSDQNPELVPAPAPEISTFTLFGTGLLVLGFFLRQKFGDAGRD
jgi:hypothetical protein